MKEFFLPILMAYLILIKAVGLVLMLVDKQKARRKAWRIPEATLLTCAVLGGSIGAVIRVAVSCLAATGQHQTKQRTGGEKKCEKSMFHDVPPYICVLSLAFTPLRT